jgi:hypothetical protein
MKRSRCAKCGASVANFVGVKDPMPEITEVGDDEGGTSWDISEIEHLANEAADSGTVTVIHLPEDRVSSLHSKSTGDARY